MVAIRKLEDIRKKWEEVTPARAPYYEAGIREPLRDWATNTLAAEDAWQQGVQEAVREKRFGKGVKAAGTTKWQKKALAVGPSRFAEGVRIAGDDYEKGFAPYREVIEKLTLPPRRARGDPANIERVKAIAMALHKKKIGAGGGK